MSQANVGSEPDHRTQSAWVKLRLTPHLRLALERYPLSVDQNISMQDGSVIVCAQVVITADFLHWIFAMGNDVEVLIPLQLRELVRNGLSSALDQYKLV